MRYNNIKKTLFGYKLVYYDSYGTVTHQLKMPRTSPLKLRPCADIGFCFIDKEGGIVQSFVSGSTDGNVFTGITKHETYARVNLETGDTTPEYAYELGSSYVVTINGAVIGVDSQAKCYRTPYLAPLTAHGDLMDNKVGSSYVFKNAHGKYVLLNTKLEKVINMEFDTPKVKIAFSDSLITAYTIGNKHYFCDKKGEVIKSIDSNLKIYRFESHNPTDKLNRFAAYDKASNSTLVYAYDEETNKIKVETTLSNKVTQRYLDNRRVLYVTVTPNGKYGLVTRTDKNLIPHVYDSITKEHLKMRYINASRVVSDSIFKVAIRKDGETKYGAYDMEGHNILPSKYANIDLSESAKMVDGTYRFMVSSVGRYYGVVDSNGETLVPLKYIHFPSNKETVTQRAGKGATIERLVLSRPNGEKVFYNVFADNILATPEEQKAIVKIYQGSSKNPTFATRSASVDRSLVYGRTSSDDDMVND